MCQKYFFQNQKTVDETSVNFCCPPYFKKNKKDVFAMFRQLASANFFVVFFPQKQNGCIS